MGAGVVLVGRFTPTDCSPGETSASWEAFWFATRAEAENWSEGPWYPEALILDVQTPTASGRL